MPVREMTFNSYSGNYEFTTDGPDAITIYWNPAKLDLEVPSHTGNQDEPYLPTTITVLPIPEKVGSDIEVYPAPEERSFRDYILILPIPDMPPVYIYLSENPDTPIWTKTKKLEPVSNAYEHWVKHGNEFSDKSFNNAKEYVEDTHDFVNNPPEGTLTKTCQNGDELFYHPETNTFAVKTKDGVPKTMFKPSDKMGYWNKQ